MTKTVQKSKARDMTQGSIWKQLLLDVYKRQVVNLFQQIGKHKLNVNLGENRLMFILLAELVKVFTQALQILSLIHIFSSIFHRPSATV